MKIARIVCCLPLLFMGLVAIYQPSVALAQSEPVAEEKIELTTNYPTLEITSGEDAEFEVALKYEGEEAREFTLVATAPKDWLIVITPDYPKDKKIASIRLSPNIKDRIQVITTPIPWLMPEPGEYTITLEVSSGEIKGTIPLKVKVTAMYTLGLAPSEELYNTSATAGKDNYFSIEVQNNGSDAIDNITLSSSKPKGWTIEFSPDKIDTLAEIDYQTIDVNIKPPPKTIAGDYQITLRASGKQATADSIDIRVSVETPTIWGWVGLGIIVLVIAGLAVIFMRFSRR